MLNLKTKLGKLASDTRDQLLAALKWAGDESHRRFVTGAIVGALGLVLHKEVDSGFVDCLVAIAIPALTAAWSKHHPEIVTPVTTDA